MQQSHNAMQHMIRDMRFKRVHETECSTRLCALSSWLIKSSSSRHMGYVFYLPV